MEIGAGEFNLREGRKFSAEQKTRVENPSSFKKVVLSEG